MLFTQRSSSHWLSGITLLLVILLALPIIVILSHIFSGSADVWDHLRSTVLTDYITNSLLLILGVGIGVLLIGISTAWLTSLYRFPGQSIFSWALLLPLAFPAYIIAYTYTGLLDASGPVQTAIREWTGLAYGEYWFFQIRSIEGAIVMMTLVLYPYVYLLARSAFLEQSASVIDAARSLGYRRSSAWFRIGLPMARPAIIAGLSLVLMETLADFGTVQYFGVSTFTTGIYRTFYGFGDTSAAAQLSALLLVFVFCLVIMERYSRRQQRYIDSRSQPTQKIVLQGKKAMAATVVCFIPILLGFLLPASVLLKWALMDAVVDAEFLTLAWHSFYLALLAGMIAVTLGLIFAYTKRLHQKPAVKGVVQLAGMGYALPGTIIAIGVIVPLTWADHQLIDFFESFEVDIGLVLSGSIVALLFAYSVRFLSISLGAIDSGLQKIRTNIDHAARLSGRSAREVLTEIHFPLLQKSLLTALLIVFVDVLKELPATLILRPFNFDTLAIKAYELASDERLIDAAPASILIVLVGIIPVIILSRNLEKLKTPTHSPLNQKALP